MAEIEMNALTRHLRGGVGDMVFKRSRGQMYAVLRPKVTRQPPTEAQVAVLRRFRKAAEYARSVRDNPDLLAFYTPIAASRRFSVHTVAMQDYLRVPVIDEIDATRYNGQAGSIIVVRPLDDAGVTGVTVRLLAADGTVLESGPAVAVEGRWDYTATTTRPAGESVVIEAAATDRPGNVTKGTKPFMMPASG